MDYTLIAEHNGRVYTVLENVSIHRCVARFSYEREALKEVKRKHNIVLSFKCIATNRRTHIDPGTQLK